MNAAYAHHAQIMLHGIFHSITGNHARSENSDACWAMNSGQLVSGMGYQILFADWLMNVFDTIDAILQCSVLDSFVLLALFGLWQLFLYLKYY